MPDEEEISQNSSTSKEGMGVYVAGISWKAFPLEKENANLYLL
jgi:hypothetical protein